MILFFNTVTDLKIDWEDEVYKPIDNKIHVHELPKYYFVKESEEDKEIRKSFEDHLKRRSKEEQERIKEKMERFKDILNRKL